MSSTSKSPKAVLLTALAVAQQALPMYSHKCSPKKFTQHQLFACLVLKNFLKCDYRGVAAMLRDCPTLAETIGLESIPHFTTIEKAAKRLLVFPHAKQLLDASVKKFMGRRQRVDDVAIDSTGMSATCASAYFVKRRSRENSPWKTMQYHRFPKLGVVCEVISHFILAYETGTGPKPDVNEFESLIGKAHRRVKLRRIVADAGYDSESNHRFAREDLVLVSIIPPKHGRPTNKPATNKPATNKPATNKPATNKPATGKYRRQMQTRFNEDRYNQRAQVETVMSMIKRRQGSHCKGKTHWSRCRELTLLVLTHNILILRTIRVFYRARMSPLIRTGVPEER